MRTSCRAAAAASVILALACGDSSSGPRIGPPASVSLSVAPTATAAVSAEAGEFAVRVLDEGGQGVPGVAVAFTAAPEGSATFRPATATTDESGTARTQVTLGTVAGTATLTARASGVVPTVSASVVGTAGAATRIVNPRRSIRLSAVGDTARIVAVLHDEHANVATGTLAFASTDPGLVTVDAAGLVRAVRVGGRAMVIASIPGRADTTLVRVVAPGAAPCDGVAAPTTLPVGGVVTVTGSDICVDGATSTSEFTVVAFNSSLGGESSLSTTVTALGIGAPPTAFRAPSASPMMLRGASGAAAARALTRDDRFHARHLSEARGLSRLFGGARASHRARTSVARAGTRGGPGSAASYSVIPASAAVGDLVSLNTNAVRGCDAAQMAWFRVKAIGSKSIVLADTLNPAGGFTDADYGRFAARFDTLVYPMDVQAFGEPSDLDGNGRVAILFTRAVNALTPSNQSSYVGGFFYTRDLFPKTAATAGAEACPASNEGEMFYMLVPDPAGVVNGNRRTVGFVDTLTTGVIAHEFQHLINASRRMYVSTTADQFEATWLDEGLSHIAEELLFYRESGKQPRQHLGDADIRGSSPITYVHWRSDASSNFRRFIEYLEDPGASSPLADDDELSTRGATWAFLRFAVDRVATSDTPVWQRFGNASTVGVETLRFALGTEPTPLLSDFAIANYVADLGINSDARYIHRSWNFRDIFLTTFIDAEYPLRTTGIADGSSSTFAVKGSSAAYLRFAVPAGQDALVSFTSGQSAPNPALRFTLIRTR